MAMRKESEQGTETAERPSFGELMQSKTFVAALVFVLGLVAGLVWIVGDRVINGKPSADASPAATTSPTPGGETAPVGGGTAGGGGDAPSVCSMEAGDQTLPSGPLEFRTVQVGSSWGVPEVAGAGPGVTTGITRCFAHSPTGALVSSVNFWRWFSSQERLPEVVRTLVVDDSNRQRLLNQIDAGWDGSTTQPQTIRGYRLEVRGADEVLVSLVTSLNPSDDRFVSWRLVMVWSGGDWKVQSPNSDSWGQESLESLSGFSTWTVK
jgi:hypothetical protein